MKTKLLKLFTVSFIAFLLVSCATMSNQKASIPYEMKTVSDTNKFFKVKIQYPQFKTLPELNTRIQDRVIGALEEFKRYAPTAWETVNSFRQESGSTENLPPLEFIIESNPVISKNEYISILFKTYRYEGGAHGETLLDSITYDVINKQELNITQASNLSIKEISEKCQDYFMQNLQYGGNDSESKDLRKVWIKDGTVADEANFRTFTFDGKTLTVYFEPYTVAPYSEGVQSVKINIK